MLRLGGTFRSRALGTLARRRDVSDNSGGEIRQVSGQPESASSAKAEIHICRNVVRNRLPCSRLAVS